MADKEYTAAVIGGGTMGADIAAVFVAGGWFVHIVDPSEKIRKNFPARLSRTLEKLGNQKAVDSFSLHRTMKSFPGMELKWLLRLSLRTCTLSSRYLASL